MTFTKSAIELFISDKAAAVTKCGAADLKLVVPEAAHWLTNFGLSVIFNDFPPPELRPFAINYIRRVQIAFIEYDLARKEVLILVRDGNGRWSPYFTALTHFEIAVSQLYIAINSVGKKANHKFFTSGDGTFEEQLNIIYNATKHDLALKELPVWFTDDAINCSKATISFSEIEDFMIKLAGVVKGLCNREMALQMLQQGIDD